MAGNTGGARGFGPGARVRCTMQVMMVRVAGVIGAKTVVRGAMSVVFVAMLKELVKAWLGIGTGL
jgi:hypothetical protein